MSDLARWRSRWRALSRTVKCRWPLVAVVALNLGAVGVTLMAVADLHAQAITKAEIRSQNFALAIDVSMSAQIGKIDLSLRTVVADLQRGAPAFRENSAPKIAALIAQQKAQFPEIEAWSVVDAAGKVVFHDSPVGAADSSVADRDYFVDAKRLNDDALLISKPLTSRLSGQPILVFARAIRDRRGDFAGVVALPLQLSYISLLFGGYDAGPGGTLALRDRDFALLARTTGGAVAPPASVGNVLVSLEFMRAVAAQKWQATFHGVTRFDQIERITTYRRLSNAPLYAVAGIAKNDALAEWRSTALRFGVVLAVFLLIGNGLAWFVHHLWRRQEQALNSLRESKQRLRLSMRQLVERDDALRAAQQAGGLGTYTMRLPDGTWTGSEMLYAIFGIDQSYPPTLDGWRQLIHADDRAALDDYFDDVIARKQVFDREYRVVRPHDGKTIWVHSLGHLDGEDAGNPVRLSGTIQDVSARKLAGERLRLTQEVFQSASEGIVVTDRDGTIIETNPAFTCITGYSSDEARGLNPRILQSGAHSPEFYAALWEQLLEDGHWEGEFVNRHKDGNTYVQFSRISAIRDADGGISHFCAVISDISEAKESQRRLEFIAYHDELTQLPNRVLLAERMRAAMAACRRDTPTLLSVCHLDLDGFKEVNERWGHEVGDELLIEVARRLQACVRSNDTVARLGGDEFVVVFTGLRDEDDARQAIARLMQQASPPYVVRAVNSEITLSIGVTIYPLDTSDEPDALIRHADQAMFEAKRGGGNRVHYFDQEGERRLRGHQQLHDRLLAALNDDELRLHYQPKVDLRNGQVVGVEALLRWQHPDDGLLPPGRFLPAIETSELTLAVGEWVLHTALQQKRDWQHQGIDLAVSVNVFGLHLQRSDFVDRLQAILAAYPDVDTRGLELEILETTALDDIDEITTRIADCARLGVQSAIDDFGTGFSSLTYLRKLPAGLVKIDRSFVIDMLGNAEDQALVQGIVGMAHSLGRTVLAEGVESIEHGVRLLRCGCDWAQGYGIARPLPPEEIPGWLTGWKMPEAWSAVC